MAKTKKKSRAETKGKSKSRFVKKNWGRRG